MIEQGWDFKSLEEYYGSKIASENMPFVEYLQIGPLSNSWNKNSTNYKLNKFSSTLKVVGHNTVHIYVCPYLLKNDAVSNFIFTIASGIAKSWSKLLNSCRWITLMKNTKKVQTPQNWFLKVEKNKNKNKTPSFLPQLPHY